MELRFWDDPETGLPHIYNHGVTEEEVRQLLNRPGQEIHGRAILAFALGKPARGDTYKWFTSLMKTGRVLLW